ncbi:MAG: hypothetical protein PHI90_04955 [Clostridia bacterium]|nr:hypothetical protein [Clostridia bacterium]MDD4048161.1 hypothetical protein [Clostridia bacterium]
MQPGTIFGQKAGQSTQQQARMPEPPQILSTKDVAYIKDALSWELDVIKKCNKFAQETQDSKIKNLIQRSVQVQQKHYNMLLKHLNPMNSASKLNS